MKHLHLVLVLFLFPTLLSAQNKYQISIHTDQNGYSYETVSNDPLNARMYTLKNGLKVYMSVYKDSPRIQTYIAVRAGSKNDPSTATGLAHYLEHILFKGTSKIGTSDWDKEKLLLDQIENLYEAYRKTKDEQQRAKIYHQIDSISILASTYSIANEYDKMLSNIGASGTNAYTFLEQTVYVNDIPSNQVDKWAEIEGERFSMVVPRLFHTELEAVYEEKNKGLDQDRRKVWEAMMAGLFQKHPYGTQTTIGTIEHLKNPSITEIKKYFDTYYRPNNMAICLSGDLDPDKTIKALDKYFGKLAPKDIPVFNPPIEINDNKPESINIYGPDAENITIAFRFPGDRKIYISHDSNYTARFYPKVKLTKLTDHAGTVQEGTVEFYETPPFFLKMISMLLTNGQAGLIDLNLNQQQKVMGAYAYEMKFNDYAAFVLGAKPREGQKLETVRDLLLSQLDSIKQGKFDEWLLKAIVNDYKISKMKEYESNRSRADAFVDNFISGKHWSDYIMEMDILENFSKKDLVDFANKNFTNDYVVLYKRVGTDTTIKKVPKPKISAVHLNREKQSEFYTKIMGQPSDSLQPVFIDFTKDLQKSSAGKLPIHYKQNVENGLFNLYYVWDFGKDNNPAYPVAAAYMDYLGTAKYPAEELKKEFFKLGCSYSFSVSNDAIYMSLSGLHENFPAALKLFEELIVNPAADPKALKDMVDGILKSRADAKLSKDIILGRAMASYAKFGPKNPFTTIISETDLKKLKPETLTTLFKELYSYPHRALYYGPEDISKLGSLLTEAHKASFKNKQPALKKYPFKDIKENVVYWVDYNMVQAEIMFLTKSVSYDPKLIPAAYLFNEYFGGGMGSLVFQEMRESKALAYSVRSKYETAGRKEDPNYISSYIGTQADKINDAIEGLQLLIEEMPKSDVLFGNSKSSLIETLNTDRITRSEILFEYEKAKKLGLDYDIRRDIYKNIKTMTFADIEAFQKKYLKGQKKIMLVVGSKDKIDFSTLSKYGKVQQLTLREIFGY
ncbi:MAG: M16 family metallopeptidase [Cytophagaceae bacterium]